MWKMKFRMNNDIIGLRIIKNWMWNIKVEYGMWKLEFAMENVKSGIRYGGICKLEFETWKLEFGMWKMEYEMWKFQWKI